MDVVIFSQDGCKQCDTLKEQLKDAGVRYKELDAGEALDPGKPGYFERHPNWRSDGVVPAVAMLQVDRALPIVVIDDAAVHYTEVLAKLVPEKSKTIIPFEQPVACEDGVCALAM